MVNLFTFGDSRKANAEGNSEMPKVSFLNSVDRVSSKEDSEALLTSVQPQKEIPTEEVLEDYRKRVEGTNIDVRSFLSTDYFNSFNSVVMIIDMLPDAPELLEEVEQWHYVDYVEHFTTSGLDFAALAIEVYPFSPPDLREAFERKVQGMRSILEPLVKTLRGLLSSGENEAFAHVAHTAAARLRTMMEEGNGIVHGYAAKAQDEIDRMF